MFDDDRPHQKGYYTRLTDGVRKGPGGSCDISKEVEEVAEGFIQYVNSQESVDESVNKIRRGEGPEDLVSRAYELMDQRVDVASIPHAILTVLIKTKPKKNK